MISDTALISRIVLADDHHAFSTLVRKYQQPIRQFLLRLTLGDTALTDDLAQEVFISLYKKISTYRAESSFSTWLHTIAYRRFLNERRKLHYSEETAILDYECADLCAFGAEPAIMVERLLSHLTLAERTCLTLAYSAGFSHPEIVAITELPLGTVKSHISRAKTKLSKWLEQSQEQNGG